MVDVSEFKRLLGNSSLSENTKKAYTLSISQFSAIYNEVNSENVNKYKLECLKDKSPNTVNLRLHALAKYAKLFKIDIDINFVKIQEPLFAENIFTEKEYISLLSFLLLKRQYEWYILFRVLACTGVRINEAHQIKYRDLKKPNKIIIGKGTKTRVIWFPYKMRKEIAPLLKNFNGDDNIIRHDDSYIRSKLRYIQKKLNIKCNLSPHEFRRFYARNVYKKVKDIQLIKDLLGHSSVKTTMRYLKVDVSNINRRMSKLVDW